MAKKTNQSPARKVGRPKEFDSIEMANALDKYTESTDDPIIEEFCLQYECSRDTFYRLVKECVQFSDSMKRAHAKQEIRTQRLAEVGKINTTFAIFKLKQKRFGWTDKQEIEQINVNADVELTEEEADEILKKFDIKR